MNETDHPMNEIAERLEKLRADAEAIEPQVRALAADERAISVDLFHATEDLDDTTKREVWDSVGWNRATDQTDLVTGHLVAAGCAHPTQDRYVLLCIEFGVEPIKVWAERPDYMQEAPASPGPSISPDEQGQ